MISIPFILILVTFSLFILWLERIGNKEQTLSETLTYIRFSFESLAYCNSYSKNTGVLKSNLTKLTPYFPLNVFVLSYLFIYTSIILNFIKWSCYFFHLNFSWFHHNWSLCLTGEKNSTVNELQKKEKH